jgi:hypothetical protein
MAFNFGQIRKNNTTEYLNVISVDIQEEQKQIFIPSIGGDVTFIDKVFHAPLSSLKGYFLRIKIYKQTTAQKIFIKMEDTMALSKGAQLIGEVEIPAGDTDDYYIFERVFMPNKDYNQIRLELERGSDDYRPNDEKTNIYGRIIKAEIVTFASIKNLITYPLKRIGVQGTPGLIMCINGEQIQIGKSGLFEINIDYTVSYFGVVIEKDSNKVFILDYQY